MLYAIRYWIPLAVIITALTALIYGVGQQNLRQGANDPQIQISEDMADTLSKTNDQTAIVPSQKVDLAKNLSPFVIIYDDLGNVTGYNGVLDNKVPEIPKGVIDHAKQNSQNKLTWEPKPGVRIAVVVTSFKGMSSGAVLVGRSLREVEKREEVLTQHVSLAWIVTMLASLVATFIFIPRNHKK